MLTAIDDKGSGSGTASSDTQICAQSSTDAAVIYTVPTGKVFKGYAGNRLASQGYRVRIYNAAGTFVRHTGGFGSDTSNYNAGSTTVELTLLAGSSVTNENGQDAFVFGVESDA
tara:strand:- start:509 stop:850 length:342 start_codon:yes stop_codon:yes gene_type:complete